MLHVSTLHRCVSIRFGSVLQPNILSTVDVDVDVVTRHFHIYCIQHSLYCVYAFLSLSLANLCVLFCALHVVSFFSY